MLKNDTKIAQLDYDYFIGLDYPSGPISCGRPVLITGVVYFARGPYDPTKFAVPNVRVQFHATARSSNNNRVQTANFYPVVALTDAYGVFRSHAIFYRTTNGSYRARLSAVPLDNRLVDDTAEGTVTVNCLENRVSRRRRNLSAKRRR